MGIAVLDRLLEVLSPVNAPWWLTGGWAVDALVGRMTRQHDDVDVLVLDRDLVAVAAAMPAAYAEHPASGARIEWDRISPLEAGVDGLALPVDFGDGTSKLQVLIGLTDGDDWVYHRGRRTIRVPLDALGRRSAGGIPCLTPKVVLLFKSRELRDRDTADFLLLLPHLDGDERAWLRARIAPWRSDHPWLAHL